MGAPFRWGTRWVLRVRASPSPSCPYWSRRMDILAWQASATVGAGPAHRSSNACSAAAHRTILAWRQMSVQALIRTNGKWLGAMVMVFVLRMAAAGHTHADTLPALQDSLVKLGYEMYNNPAEPERMAANFAFVKTLVAALNTPHSYDFAFDSLDMVSLLHAPDGKFRIFSWHLPLNDGSYLYYGAIQLRTADGSLALFPLLDNTYEIDGPDDAILSNTEWYGARYYRIIPFGTDYVLLGW